MVQEVGPDQYRVALERHQSLMRAAFREHAGIERGTQGDSFTVVFADAPAAVAAAVAAQRALATGPWPDGATVRVRIGIHTGVAMIGGDDYVGLDINRAARISAVASGGRR